jgi:hypothetical protein
MAQKPTKAAVAAPPTNTPVAVDTPPPSLADPAAVANYKALYDTLGRAYWEASDINAKDTIQGARDAIYDILTDLNRAQLESNTALYLAVMPKIRQTNAALEKIKDQIAQITKNINTASSVVSAVAKVISVVGAI